MNYDMGVNRHVLIQMKYIITEYLWNAKRSTQHSIITYTGKDPKRNRQIR